MPPPPSPPPRSAPPALAAPATAPAAAPAARAKSVTFCTHCKYSKYEHPLPADSDVRYYSDPGQPDPPKPKTKKKKERFDDSTDSELRYYSEPDVKYFEIDYVFLRELRDIARSNCPKCRRKRSRMAGRDCHGYRQKQRQKPARSRERYVRCDGRLHGRDEHCRACCKTCSRSSDTLDSLEDDYSLACTSYSGRGDSAPAGKSVCFAGPRKDEPNYTASSFTDDLKKFLLKPASPRLSLREKFIISFKQELEATKRSPKLKAIKGLWKSY